MKHFNGHNGIYVDGAHGGRIDLEPNWDFDET